MINKIISAIGNNNSIYPLLVRDCGIEVPTKVYKTYKQNKDDKEIAYLATREKILDEYLTSAAWLGGIPLIGLFFNKFIQSKGLPSNISIKLLQNETKLNEIDKTISSLNINTVPEELKQKRVKIYLQSLSGNIDKFSNISGAENAVKDLIKIKNNQNLYKKLIGYKFFAEIALPIVLMGFIIPKTVYALTAATKKRRKEKQLLEIKSNYSNINIENINQFTGKNKSLSFGNKFSSFSDFTTVQKMAITDGGYAVGRVATARKKRGAIDIAFKMGGMLYLNFVAPKQIEKILSYLSKKIFNLDVNLDPIILADSEFFKQINDKTLKLPQTNNIKDMLDFIDNEENSSSLFVKYAQKLRKISMLKNNIRDPRAYVDEIKLAELRDNMENFMNNISQIKDEISKKLKPLNLKEDKQREILRKSIKKYVLKAKSAKTFNILSNVALSSYLLAVMLPDAQYLFREKVLGTKLEPDLL